MDKNNILPITFGANSQSGNSPSIQTSSEYFTTYAREPTAIPQEQNNKQQSVTTRYRKPPLLTSAEAADFLGLKTGTLVNWRCTKNQEIPFIKVGGRVRYREQDLLAWLERQLVIPTGWEEAGGLS